MNMENDSDVMEPNHLADAIIYEDADVVVINKPSGIAVHGDGKGVQATVVDWLRTYAPECVGVGETDTQSDTGTIIDRSGIVHRLDKDTSGVLLLVKHQSAHTHYKKQFHDRLVTKIYRAFVYGEVKEWVGTIDRPIGRSAKDWRRRSAERGAKGVLRDAVTRYELIGNGMVDGEWFSYLDLFPETGRTHQLRVHLKAINHPIVQDPLYAGKRCAQSHNVGFDRLALHAHILEVVSPGGDPLRLIAPVPQSFHIAADSIATD